MPKVDVVAIVAATAGATRHFLSFILCDMWSFDVFIEYLSLTQK